MPKSTVAQCSYKYGRHAAAMKLAVQHGMRVPWHGDLAGADGLHQPDHFCARSGDGLLARFLRTSRYIRDKFCVRSGGGKGDPRCELAGGKALINRDI